jgi:hypothetical protein
MAGFNVYELDDGGAVRPIEWHRLTGEAGGFRQVAVAQT